MTGGGWVGGSQTCERQHGDAEHLAVRFVLPAVCCHRHIGARLKAALDLAHHAVVHRGEALLHRLLCWDPEEAQTEGGGVVAGAHT